MKRKTLSKRLNLRVDDDLHRKVTRLAGRQQRSEGAIVRSILRQHFEREDGVLDRIGKDVSHP